MDDRSKRLKQAIRAFSDPYYVIVFEYSTGDRGDVMDSFLSTFKKYGDNPQEVAEYYVHTFFGDERHSPVQKDRVTNNTAVYTNSDEEAKEVYVGRSPEEVKQLLGVSSDYWDQWRDEPGPKSEREWEI